MSAVIFLQKGFTKPQMFFNIAGELDKVING